MFPNYEDPARTKAPDTEEDRLAREDEWNRRCLEADDWEGGWDE